MRIGKLPKSESLKLSFSGSAQDTFGRSSFLSMPHFSMFRKNSTMTNVLYNGSYFGLISLVAVI